MLYHTVNLIIGDWSGDGHEHTQKTTISSNLTHSEIERAQKKGAQDMGFDICQHCNEYEDSSIPWAFVDLLLSQGLEFFDQEYWHPRDETPLGPSINQEDYVSIYLHQAKQGNPNFEHEVVADNDIQIGGYGLFH